MNYYHFSIKPRLAWLITSLAVFAFLGGAFFRPVLAAETREFTAAIAPTSALTNQTQSYTATFTNSLLSTKKIKSAKLINIDGFTAITGLSLGGGASSNWAVALVGNEIKMNKTGGHGAADISAGESFTVIFTATAPGSVGVKQWTAQVWETDNWTNPEFSLTSLEPTVTVMAWPTITIIKHTLGGDGAFDFTGDLGAQQIITESGVGQTGPMAVVPGTYHIAETAQAHWREISSDCDNVVVAAGQDVICTIVNEHDTRITISKTAVGGDGLFHFTGLGDQGFDLNTALSPDHVIGSFFDIFTELSNNIGITDITIAEDSATGWTTTDQPCVLNDLQPGVDQTCRFTNIKLGTITGAKFEDLNGNGVKDQGEPGLPGWTIKLKNSNDQVVAETNTDANGLYSFFDVFVDVYTVEEVGQTGWTQTTVNPAPIQIQPGSVVNDIDFGNFHEVSITGLKWDDTNGDGIHQPTEPGQPGVNIEIRRVLPGHYPVQNMLIDTELVQLSLTGAGGSFKATVQTPGNYVATEQTPLGSQPTYPVDSFFDIFVDLSGQTIDHGAVHGCQAGPITSTCAPVLIEFGNFKLITVTVQKDVVAPDGRTDVNDPHKFKVTLDGQNEQSIIDQGLEALYNGVGPGLHALAEIGDPDFDLLRISNGDTELPNGQFTPVSGQDMTIVVTNRQKPGIIIIDKTSIGDDGLFTFTGNNGLGEKQIATVNGSSNNFIGSFFDVFTELNSEFTITEQPQDGWIADSEPCVVTVNPGQIVTCHFTNIKQGQIIVKKITVGGDGLFTFTANYNPAGFNLSGGGQNDSGYLNPGDYNVSEDNVDGWALTSAVCDDGSDPATIHLGANETVTCTFTNTKQDTRNKGEIRGIKFEDLNGNGIFDQGEKPLGGWVIYLDANNNGQKDLGEKWTVTKNNGEYRFKKLPAGIYTVREVLKKNWVQTYPASGLHLVNLATGQIISGKNFGNFKLGQIRGIKYEDKNGNGKKDRHEPRLAGWVIYLDANNNGALDGGEISTMTDENGKYRFDNLLPGTYHAREVLLDGWRQTEPETGVYDILMTSGLKAKHRDFGNVQIIIEQ